MVNTGREEFYIAFVKPNLHIAKQANMRRQQDFRCEFKIEPSNLIDSVFPHHGSWFLSHETRSNV